MAKTTGTVYVKIKPDTSALIEAMEQLGGTIEMLKAAELHHARRRAKFKQDERMRRFDAEMERIRAWYWLARVTKMPAWKLGSPPDPRTAALFGMACMEAQCRLV